MPAHLLETARFPYFASVLILGFMIVGFLYNATAAVSELKLIMMLIQKYLTYNTFFFPDFPSQT